MKRLILILLISLPVMAYEDFTTYTEVDEGSDITVISTKVTWSSMECDETSYVYYAYSNTTFNGDFTHQFETMWTDNYGGATEDCETACWMLAKKVAGFEAINDGSAADDDWVALQWEESSDGLEMDLRFSIGNAGGYVGGLDTWTGPVEDTLYYVTIAKDDDGAGSYARYTCTIRTGSHTGTVQDTLTRDADESHDSFTHIYAVNNTDENDNVPDFSGYTQNLELNLVSSVAQIF